MSLAPVLKSPGSKWRLASEIVSVLPRHRVYLEPCAGSLAVLFRKPPSCIETVNDVDGEIVNLYRVLRDRDSRERLAEAVEFTAYAAEELWVACEVGEEQDGIERARRLVVRSHMNFGSRLVGVPHFAYARTRSGGSSGKTWAALPERVRAAGERLKEVQVLNRDARQVVRAHASEDVCIYADPPYPRETRKGAGRLYRHEMDEAAHEEFLMALKAHPGPVLLSGYQCPLYEGMLGGWSRVEFRGYAQSHKEKKETLYLNPDAAARRANTLF